MTKLEKIYQNKTIPIHFYILNKRPTLVNIFKKFEKI